MPKTHPVNFFFMFIQFLEKIGQNNKLASPPLHLAPPLREILDAPLQSNTVNCYILRHYKDNFYCLLTSFKIVNNHGFC